MRKTFILIFILLLNQPLKADHYITLNNFISVKIPGSYSDTLTRDKLEGYGTYWDACFYEALCMKDATIKSNELTTAELAEYYNNFTDNLILQLKGKIKEQTEVYLDDYYLGRYIYYEALNDAKLPQLWHTQIFLIDKTLYVFSINAAKGKRNILDSYSRSYLNSIRIKTTENTFVEPKKYEMSEDDIVMKQKNEKEFAQTIKKQNAFNRIKYMLTITAISIIVFAAAIGGFFIIRHYYKKYD